jgi:hypothetical protein
MGWLATRAFSEPPGGVAVQITGVKPCAGPPTILAKVSPHDSVGTL